MRDSIASSGAADGCLVSSGTLTSGGHNLDQGTSCPFTATGDLRGRNPALGSLAPHGGFAPTIAPAAGSPVIDAAEGGSGCPATDQRGVARPLGRACDIGAFEAAAALPAGLPAPVLGKRFNAVPLSGKVFISLPAGTARASASVPGLKGRRFVPLVAARQVPVGSILDTRKGKVRLTTATGRRARRSGRLRIRGLSGAAVGQGEREGSDRAPTQGRELQVVQARKEEQRRAVAPKRTVRRLRSKVKGRFRTRGRYSAATVRGTEWLTPIAATAR